MAHTSRTARRLMLGMAAGTLVTTTPALALDTHFVGARGQAMAGANTASVDGVDAQYYNPAAFGFFNMRGEEGDQLPMDNNNLGRKDFGLGVDVGAGYRLTNNAGTYLDRLSDANLDQYDDGINSKAEVEDAVQLTNDLAGIDQPQTGFTADTTLGAGFRVGHFGVGVRGSAQAVGQVSNLDQDNLGFGVANSDDIYDAYTSGGTTPNTSYESLSDSQRQTLEGAGYSTQDIQAIDDAANSADIDSGNLNDAVNLLKTAGPNNSGGSTSIEDNQTQVTFRGFGLVEVPISYGYAVNEHWSIGGNAKFMQGRVYSNQVLVFDDDNSDVVAKTDQRYEETTTFGVDLGVMGRWEMFQVGLMGRNLNSPEFDGFSYTNSNGNRVNVDSVTYDPQARAGVAFIPFNTLTLEMDYDLTKNETLLDGYDTQFLSAGLEWDAFRFLALRAGAYKNMAEDDIGAVYTAGLGLNLWAVRVDVAGAMSAETSNLDGSDVPEEGRATAEVTVDF